MVNHSLEMGDRAPSRDSRGAASRRQSQCLSLAPKPCVVSQILLQVDPSPGTADTVLPVTSVYTFSRLWDCGLA